MTEELTVAELATLAKFASPDSLLAKLLRIYHAQTDLIAELQECLDVETPIMSIDDIADAEGKPTPEFIEALTDALREYGEEPAAPTPEYDVNGWKVDPDEKCCHDCDEPAAPEPSAETESEATPSLELRKRLLRERVLRVKAEDALRLLGDWANPLLVRAESAEAQLEAVLQALGICEDVRCGRDPVEAARSIIKESCLAGDAWSRLFEAEAQLAAANERIRELQTHGAAAQQECDDAEDKLAAVQCALLDPYSNNELRIANAHKALAPASQDTKD